MTICVWRHCREVCRVNGLRHCRQVIAECVNQVNVPVISFAQAICTFSSHCCYFGVSFGDLVYSMAVNSALANATSTMNVPPRAPRGHDEPPPPPPPPAPPTWEIVQAGRYNPAILKTFLYYNISPVRTHTMHLTHSQEIMFVGDPDIHGFNNCRSPIHGFHNWAPDCERWTAEFNYAGNICQLTCLTFIKDPNEAGLTSYRGYLTSELHQNYLFSPTRRLQPWCVAVQKDLIAPDESVWL